MSDVTYEKFQHYGTEAERLAFTPDPAPGIQPIYIWLETDTGNIYAYYTSWVLISGTGIILPPPTPSAVPNTFLMTGGVVIWEVNYDYRVSAATYYINGLPYTSAEDTITLDAADPTDDRIDVIALDTLGAVVKITGDPSANPSEPSVDPAQYLKLAIVFVQAASTEPTITDELVYADDAGPPTEWAFTSSGASINVSSTNNPHSGTKDIEGTAVVAGVYASGVASTPIEPNDFEVLIMFIRSKATWNNSRGLLITLRNSGAIVGAQVQIRRTGTFGFDSSVTGSYQLVAIPIINFAIPEGSEIDEIRIEDFGGSIGFYIDDISFQVGGSTPSGESGITQAEADARYAPLVHAPRHSSGGADPVSVLNLAGFPGGTTTFLRADGTFNVPSRTAVLGIIVDGAGSVLTTGVKDFIQIPFACTITAWTILSTDPAVLSGDIEFDIYKDTYANYPPDSGDSIVAAAPPEMTGADKATDSTLTGWTTAIAAGDVLGFEVVSVATLERVTLELTLRIP